MAPRANWKGYLRLSLVTCPVALFPATSESEKVSFNQINKRTGHRIKYQRVDAETGEDVDNEDIVKGYKVDADTYIEVTKDELDNIALESNRTIDIDQFVPRNEIDDLYVVRPYYLVPDGKVGHDAYAVIRETIKATDKVALARVVLTNREHVIALEARDKGLVGLLLRYPYEVRQSGEYFDGIQDVKITKDMLDLARHIVDQKSGHFDPDNFEDHYETALIDLINQKRAGRPIEKVKVKTEGNVINLMDALRQSLKGAPAPARARRRSPPRRRTARRRSRLPVSARCCCRSRARDRRPRQRPTPSVRPPSGRQARRRGKNARADRRAAQAHRFRRRDDERADPAWSPSHGDDPGARRRSLRGPSEEARRADRPEGCAAQERGPIEEETVNQRASLCVVCNGALSR